jgi:hypothetical protein
MNGQLFNSFAALATRLSYGYKFHQPALSVVMHSERGPRRSKATKRYVNSESYDRPVTNNNVLHTALVQCSQL